jgi:prepilin-type processing-associated H-X9-DG protein
MKCSNNLKQMGLAIHNYNDTNGYLPPGGFVPWGGEGSWPYHILSYMEQDNLAKLNTAKNVDPLRYRGASPNYFCPSRRSPAPVSAQGGRYMMDYASATPANSPNSWDQFWYGDIWGMGWVGQPYNGVIVRGGQDSSGAWQGGQSTLAGISDGTSNTLMVSEKRLNPSNYMSGDWHDDCGWGDGWDPDVVRYTGYIPQRDSVTGVSGYEFGSAHPSGINGLFGDGSVRFIRYSVDPNTFNLIGHRSDGQAVNLNGL